MQNRSVRTTERHYMAEENTPVAQSETKKEGGKVRVSKQTLKARLKQTKPHSKRYEEQVQKVDVNKTYSLNEAIELVKATAKTKFDSSVELHLHLTPKKGKKGVEDEYMRGIMHLPNGLGKNRNVVILNEELIDAIAKTQVLDFDVAIATPALMPKMGKIAKILGTKGKMPNPKVGTVTDKPEEVKKEIEAGRVEFRQDAGRNVHQMIGKSSWETEKLVANAQAVLKSFAANRIARVTVTSTMGPAVKVTLG